MATVTDLIDALSGFNLKTEVIKIFQDESIEIIGLNQEQMMHGRRSDGQRIGKYETTPSGDMSEYAKEKFDMNSLAGKGNVDLKYDGDYQNAMKVKLTGMNIDIDSGDWKSDMLKRMYTQKIFGLTKDSWQKFIDVILLDRFFVSLEMRTGLEPK